ncbi:Ribosomal RNA large subunit methyltransferase L [Roseovarius albus]|uniref:Ribosomal RNA large subunit methyltransferase L n=2 Tax=Roseovarius albus TaxID=1247867 RepID=A0A1X7A8G7_9RHOB|nr:Ribosomal RNA large subunit methyltransferase L [Roseovarius albus]
MSETFEIFLAATPGLELPLFNEVREAGFSYPHKVPGGVTIQGGWPDVWRANLVLRGASRVLARIGSFRVMHLAQLDKRARKFPWSEVLRADVPIKVDVTCRKSRIYHAKAATQRIERALTETLGVALSADAPLRLMARIEDDLCTFSIDTSGEPLHKRGFKEAVVKAPMRENMAAMFLRECGYTGDEPVLDPMCGSGTFVIEAAEVAAGLMPGRARNFAFEQLANFDPDQWVAFKAEATTTPTDIPFYGSDRDTGAVRAASANADRAGVQATFTHCPISDLQRPDEPAGLIIINPPYGARISNKKPLYALHNALGQVLKERFSGWRVGLVTSDADLAKTTALPFDAPGPYVAHGGLKIRLWQTRPLP